MEQNYIGVIPDPRTEYQKARDYYHNELYGATLIQWIEKNRYKEYSLRDQDGSSSCVGQGTAKAMEALTGIVDSAHPTYSRRPNKPSEGMYLQAAGDLRKNQGTTTEERDPSQKLDELHMDAPVLVSTPTLISNYAFVAIDIDQIAQAIDLHKGVALTFESNYDEWIDIPVVKGTPKWGHCVCAVDYTLYKGEKAIVIEDSWGHATSIGNGGQRIITESFLKARCTGAMYLIPKTTDPVPKPQHTFINQLTYGMMGSADVIALQDCLKYLGFFPANVHSTGNFLSATAHAVIKYQISKGIMDFANEKDIEKVKVGKKTLVALNKDFN